MSTPSQGYPGDPATVPISRSHGLKTRRSEPLRLCLGPQHGEDLSTASQSDDVGTTAFSAFAYRPSGTSARVLLQRVQAAEHRCRGSTRREDGIDPSDCN